MKIEIWADFTCPYCFLGKRNLEFAMERCGHQENIVIEYKSFELDPEADSSGRETKHGMLMRKYGISMEKAVEMTEQISKQGEEIDIKFRFENMVHTNTFHAHRLVKYATKIQQDAFLIERLFEKYFIENENIGAKDVLQSLACEMEMDISEADAFLCLNKHAKTVREEEQLATELGITSVPFFIFNETYAISGAHPPEVFVEILEEILLGDEDTPKKAHTSSYCTGNECHTE